jgi:cation:H+ antiporter
VDNARPMVGLAFFVLGLVALVAGAELLVRGASKLALAFGISPLVVGLTVVAFGTSSPEMAVSVRSVMAGQVDIAVGNVVGSNIFNVLFILGACAVIAPLLVAEQIVKQEVPIMIGASVLLYLFAADQRIGKAEAAMMLGAMIAYTVFLVVQSRRAAAGGPLATEMSEATDARAASAWDRHWSVQIALVAAGLGLLVLGATWLVDAAIGFAKALGVSEMVIGLTIVAAGTSMPEVATSILATIRGHRDIAVGNVIGSNTFNVLGVLGLSGVAATGDLSVPPAMVNFDLPVMLAVAVACLPIFFTGHLIARWEGAVFLAFYVAYTVYLILAAQQHDALGAFSGVMTSFVLPLVVLTIVVVLIRQGPAQRR